MPPEQAGRPDEVGHDGGRRLQPGGDALRDLDPAVPVRGRRSVAEILRQVLDAGAAQSPLAQPQGRPRPGDDLPEMPGEGAGQAVRPRPSCWQRSWRTGSTVSQSLTIRPVTSAIERLKKWARDVGPGDRLDGAVVTVLVVVVAGFAGVTWQWAATPRWLEWPGSTGACTSPTCSSARRRSPTISSRGSRSLVKRPRHPGVPASSEDLRDFEWYYLPRPSPTPNTWTGDGHKGSSGSGPEVQPGQLHVRHRGGRTNSPGSGARRRDARLSASPATPTSSQPSVLIPEADGSPPDPTTRRLGSGTWRTGKRHLPTFRAVLGRGRCVSFSAPDGRTLVLTCDDHKLHFLDPETGVVRHEEPLPVLVEKRIGPSFFIAAFNHSRDPGSCVSQFRGWKGSLLNPLTASLAGCSPKGEGRRRGIPLRGYAWFPGSLHSRRQAIPALHR